MKTRLGIGAFCLALAFGGLAPAEAKTFKTQFIRFELPANWSCSQEEIDWVCQPDNIAERSEVILVAVTKARNEVDDTLEKYLETLKAPRDMRDLLGNAYKSETKYARLKKIRDQEWADALTFGAEIPRFYTRYLASTKEQVAGLISYSIAESVYPKWATVMDGLVDSLELTFDPKAFAEAMSSGGGSLLGSRGRLQGRLAPKEGEVAAADTAPAGGDKKKMVFGAIVVAAALGYLLYKRRQKGA